MNSNAIMVYRCTGCKERVLCMRVLSVIDTQVNMCYACITRAFDRRIEKQMEEEELLIPDDEEEGYNRQMMAEENERQMEATERKD
jgi:hypothetical protein